MSKKVAREQLDYGARPRGRRRVRPHVRRAANRAMLAVVLALAAFLGVMILICRLE